MFNILLVEDDEILTTMIKAKLQNEGFSVVCVQDGSAGLNMLEIAKFSLIITDVMMPKMDGIEFCKEVRKFSTTPILMITAKSEFEDKELGFGVGADDYMTKPVNLKELVLRVNALLRRAKITTAKRIEIGSTTLDYATLTVTENAVTTTLTPKEFYLLFLLLSNEGKIFTRYEIMEEIWGYESESNERVVDTHIKKLRASFKDSSDFEIVTIRNLGYKAVKKSEIIA